MASIDTIKKNFVIFGNFYDLLSTKSNELFTFFREKKYNNISNILEQSVNGGTTQSFKFNDGSQKSFVVRLNRIDIDNNRSEINYDDIKEVINELVNKFSLKINRVAINLTLAFADEKSLFTNKIINSVCDINATGNNYNELLFRFNNIKQIDKEEINIIYSIENGLFQKVSPGINASNAPAMKAVFFHFDINTSLKNIIERFDSKYLNVVFPKLENELIDAKQNFIKLCL